MTKTYKEMYEEAARHINSKEGSYKGYRGGNALSLYVDDKYGVNAVDETAAMNELHGALDLIDYPLD